MLETCCLSFYTQSHLRTLKAFLLTTLSSPHHFKSILCWALLLTSNMYTWIVSLNVYMSPKMVPHPDRRLTSWNSWVPGLGPPGCSAVFIHSGIPKVQPTPGSALSTDSHGQINLFIFVLEKLRTFTKIIGKGMVPFRERELQSRFL